MLFFRIAVQTILKIGDIPQVLFLEFLDKEKVVGMIVEVQDQAPEDLKVQKTARTTMCKPSTGGRRPCVQRQGPTSCGDAETGFNHPEHPDDPEEMPVVTQRHSQTIQ